MSNEFQVGPDRDAEGNKVYTSKPETDATNPNAEEAQREFMEDQADRHDN